MKLNNILGFVRLHGHIIKYVLEIYMLSKNSIALTISVSGNQSFYLIFEGVTLALQLQVQ